MTSMRALQYGLIATALNLLDQCTDLTRHLIQGVLPNMGIVRTANSVLVMTPHIYRGLGIVNLYIQQLVDHLKVICNHGGIESETGMLISIELELLSLQVGVGRNSFKINPEIVSWTEHCWWREKLLGTHKYEIDIDGDISELKTWMKKDGFLMNDFANHYHGRNF